MPAPHAHTADRLFDLRTSVQTVPELEDDLIPASITDAYAVQDLLTAKFNQPIAAWKVGATATAIQERLGVSEPFSGPVHANAMWSSPAVIEAARFTHTLLESEFAFRVSERMAPRADAGYMRDDVIAAVDALVPAIEIIAPCFTPAIGGAVTSRIADLGVSAGLVHGTPHADWRDLDLAAHSVALRVGDDVVGAGTGALVLGDPVASLVWAVNHLGTRGITLEPGQLISTGTVTGLYELAPGATAVADFGALGTVSVTFTA